MGKRLIYLDHCVISAYIKGEVEILPPTDGDYVFSEEHFNEISRSNEPEKYLSALDRINAKLICIDRDIKNRLTNNYSVFVDSAFNHYEQHQEHAKYTKALTENFAPLQAWINGGNDKETLLEVPNTVSTSFTSMISPHKDITILDTISDISELINIKLSESITTITKHDNNISNIRKNLFGKAQGVNDLKGPHVIDKIWDSVICDIGNLTKEQFLGLKPLDKQDYEDWPLVLGTIGCCAALDVFGYQSEQKCRKIKKVANIQSDATHIAMGLFCDEIYSFDKKLIARAAAIYEYFRLPKKLNLLNH